MREDPLFEKQYSTFEVFVGMLFCLELPQFQYNTIYYNILDFFWFSYKKD